MTEELLSEPDMLPEAAILTEAERSNVFGGRSIGTMGNRPQDHRERDLLFGSLLRDVRTRKFRDYAPRLPAWAPSLPKGWPKEFIQQGQQLIMLGLSQQTFLSKLRRSIEHSENEDRATRMLDAMEECVPIGALFDRRDEGDHTRHCGYSKVCPWCHTRNVERIYRRLVAGPCSVARLEGKSLVLVRLSGCNPICGGASSLDRTEVQSIRESGRQSAKSVVKDLGLDGGIVFYQFGPKRVYGTRGKVVDNAFGYESTMIGESKSITPDRVRQYEDSGYDVLLVPAETPHTLRYFLFGTSHKFPVGRIEGLTATGTWFTKYGIPGAASLQPWFLFNETQAWSYLAATAGTRLCDAFGTWRKNGQPPQRRKGEECDCERLPRKQALRNTNNERHYDAANRRVGLMPKAEQVFRRLRSEMGRNPGSTALRAGLADAGLAVSDRDSRWLAKQMPLRYEQAREPMRDQTRRERGSPSATPMAQNLIVNN